MKRKAETVLTWIGVGIHGAITLLLTVVVLMAIIGHTINQSQTNNDQSSMLLAIIIVVISYFILLMSVVAGVKIKKSNKFTGILLITTGVITLIGNFISAILWFISGIMLLVRKPKPSLYETSVRSRVEKQDHSDPFAQGLKQQTSNVNKSWNQDKDESTNPFKY
ncbi:DUF4064 domain-containing protein [Staphylococcus arlettae]|uniref:DUF4064 domain-containing protein n=1 Tax=Staphylococcus arlettae TaxID=29378 RepID=UPI003CF127F7